METSSEEGAVVSLRISMICSQRVRTGYHECKDFTIFSILFHWHWLFPRVKGIFGLSMGNISSILEALLNDLCETKWSLARRHIGRSAENTVKQPIVDLPDANRGPTLTEQL